MASQLLQLEKELFNNHKDSSKLVRLPRNCSLVSHIGRSKSRPWQRACQIPPTRDFLVPPPSQLRDIRSPYRHKHIHQAGHYRIFRVESRTSNTIRITLNFATQLKTTRYPASKHHDKHK